MTKENITINNFYEKVYKGDLPPTAYGWSFNCTKNKEVTEACNESNERSIRHYSMTEEERKRDDFNRAWNRVLNNRQIEEDKERSKYRNHYVQDIK